MKTIQKAPEGLNRKFKRLLRSTIMLLPQSLRAQVIRRMVKVNLNPDPRLSFHAAESPAERQEALSVLHDCYVEQGFMKPDPSGMRITPYHLIPDSKILVVKWANRVVGTVTLIPQTQLGLPLEKLFKIDHLKGQRVVEISSLAIAPEFRNRMSILILLCIYLYEFCRTQMKADTMVIACNPRDRAFYEDLFHFERLEGSTSQYEFVSGAPAIGLSMNLGQAYRKSLEIYAEAPIKRNLLALYLAAPTLSCFHFPSARVLKLKRAEARHVANAVAA